MDQEKYNRLRKRGLSAEQIAHFEGGGNARTLVGQPTPEATAGPATRSTLLGNAPREDDLLSGAIDTLVPIGMGVAGGLAGVPGGPLGVMGGAALGGAGGEAYRQNLRAMLGYASPETSGEAAGRMGVSAATDAALGGAGAAAGPLLKGGAFLASKAASAPILRHIPGASAVRRMAGDIPGVVDAAGRGLNKLAGGGAKEAAERSAARAAGAAPEAVAETVETAAKPSGWEALKQMKRPRKNASAAERDRFAIEVEEAIQSIPKLSAAGRKSILRRMGIEGAEGAPKGKVVGEIKPAQGKAAKVEPKEPVKLKQPAKTEEGPRLDNDYYSESQGKRINIKDMHPAHLRAAINKKQREIAAVGEKRAPVAKAQLDDLLKELTHRMKTQAEHTAY